MNGWGESGPHLFHLSIRRLRRELIYRAMLNCSFDLMPRVGALQTFRSLVGRRCCVILPLILFSNGFLHRLRLIQFRSRHET